MSHLGLYDRDIKYCLRLHWQAPGTPNQLTVSLAPNNFSSLRPIWTKNIWLFNENFSVDCETQSVQSLCVKAAATLGILSICGRHLTLLFGCKSLQSSVSIRLFYRASMTNTCKNIAWLSIVIITGLLWIWSEALTVCERNSWLTLCPSLASIQTKLTFKNLIFNAGRISFENWRQLWVSEIWLARSFLSWPSSLRLHKVCGRSILNKEVLSVILSQREFWTKLWMPWMRERGLCCLIT